MTTLEDRLSAALTARAAHAAPRCALAAVVDAAAMRHDVAGYPLLMGPHEPRAATEEPAERLEAERGGRNWRRSSVSLAAAATITVGVVAIAQLVGRSGGPHEPGWGTPAGVPAMTTPALTWQTPHVSLSADQIVIDYGGRTLSPPPTAVVVSTIGGRASEGLSIRWSEQDVTVRWDLSFRLRGGEWWIDRMVVADMGGATPDVDLASPSTTAAGATPAPPPMPPMIPEVSIDQDGARTPLGQALGGDVDVAGGSSAATARVRITGLRVLGFRDRVILPDDDGSQPTVINALPPAPELPSDVRPSGLYGPESEWMTVLVARDELTRECMAAAGVEYPRIPDDAIERRVDRRAAAAEFGYHPGADDEPLLNGGASGIPDKLSGEEKDAYYAALGVNAGGQSEGGCLQQAQEAMGGNLDLSPMRGWDAVIRLSGRPIETVHAQAYDDPNVIAVLTRWRQCVYAAVGETAANPDELKRIYTFEDGEPKGGRASDHEKDVAVADVDCQRQVDWPAVWDAAVVERERAAMGAQVGEYDQWVRDYQAVIANAEQVLADRGIVVPTLD